jgi:hypothetical protein
LIKMFNDDASNHILSWLLINFIKNSF